MTKIMAGGVYLKFCDLVTGVKSSFELNVTIAGKNNVTGCDWLCQTCDFFVTGFKAIFNKLIKTCDFFVTYLFYTCKNQPVTRSQDLHTPPPLFCRRRTT